MKFVIIVNLIFGLLVLNQAVFAETVGIEEINEQHIILHDTNRGQLAAPYLY